MAHFDVVPGESQVVVSASTSLQSVRMATGDLVGHLDAETTSSGVFLGVPVPSCRIELRVDSLHSGNWFYDREGKRRFDADHYPLVAAELVTAIPVGAGLHRVTWLLAFHGAAQEIEGELTARAVDAGSITVDGDHTFDSRDWGLRPAGLLGIRVHPEARFDVHLLARRRADPAEIPGC